MKTRIGILLLVILASCSDQITVRTDYDRSVKIAEFRTFTWLDKQGIEERNNPLYYNELNDKRIREAVIKQLTGKGYVQDVAEPRLKVHYHIVIEDKTQVRSDTYSPYWIKSERDVYTYREGTLIIDLMDARNEALLWRGWAISALSDKDQMSDELIHEAVAKIFGKLPPAEVQK
ncbi:MAG: DUF4136 domain-containing protein [Cyclobacteriaceae bacterium]|nr:DUF4136 domain-containing protein [Cyclobacteriaceae bacterium]